MAIAYWVLILLFLFIAIREGRNIDYKYVIKGEHLVQLIMFILIGVKLFL